jgi:hypothetical protein
VSSVFSIRNWWKSVLCAKFLLLVV